MVPDVYVFKNIKIFSNCVKAEKTLCFFKLSKGGFPSAFCTLTSFLQRFISVKLNYFLPSSWPETPWKVETNAGLGFHWNREGEGDGLKWSGLIKNFLSISKSNGRLTFSAAKVRKFVFSKLMEGAQEGYALSCAEALLVWQRSESHRSQLPCLSEIIYNIFLCVFNFLRIGLVGDIFIDIPWLETWTFFLKQKINSFNSPWEVKKNFKCVLRLKPVWYWVKRWVTTSHKFWV